MKSLVITEVLRHIKNQKDKIHKFNFFKIGNFCSLRDSITRRKRWGTCWENIFANHISNKRLISEMHADLLKFNKKNTIRKWVQEMIRHDTEKDIWIADKHTERHSASLALGKCKLRLS